MRQAPLSEGADYIAPDGGVGNGQVRHLGPANSAGCTPRRGVGHLFTESAIAPDSRGVGTDTRPTGGRFFSWKRHAGVLITIYSDVISYHMLAGIVVIIYVV
jgi:hypothetical protein